MKRDLLILHMYNGFIFRWKDTTWESDEAVAVSGAAHMETRYGLLSCSNIFLTSPTLCCPTLNHLIISLLCHVGSSPTHGTCEMSQVLLARVTLTDTCSF